VEFLLANFYSFKTFTSELSGDCLKGSKESIMANEGSGYPGSSDEEGWDKEGLFKTVDELCKLKKGGFQLQELLTPSNKDRT
jgi:hypothetical protein